MNDLHDAIDLETRLVAEAAARLQHLAVGTEDVRVAARALVELHVAAELLDALADRIEAAG